MTSRAETPGFRLRVVARLWKISTLRARYSAAMRASARSMRVRPTTARTPSRNFSASAASNSAQAQVINLRLSRPSNVVVAQVRTLEAEEEEVRAAPLHLHRAATSLPARTFAIRNTGADLCCVEKARAIRQSSRSAFPVSDR